MEESMNYRGVIDTVLLHSLKADMLIADKLSFNLRPQRDYNGALERTFENFSPPPSTDSIRSNAKVQYCKKLLQVEDKIARPLKLIISSRSSSRERFQDDFSLEARSPESQKPKTRLFLMLSRTQQTARNPVKQLHRVAGWNEATSANSTPFQVLAAAQLRKPRRRIAPAVVRSSEIVGRYPKAVEKFEYEQRPPSTLGKLA
ncbi:hypothetical protein WN51_04114 [Melipona quadrifasciata]|uniref:Uncharacterized protein n=1 Tax=Melipona quadrifasciata TaxID=166423 RepID=A0A0N1IT17_9HYME|nr:hypothetical protein WN51_04114 [Melipona quadrifasciata]